MIMEARSYHGFVSFYRIFIKHFGSIMALIIQCLGLKKCEAQ